MENKGYTIVEVLAVIAIIMTLLIVITPKVLNHLETSAEVAQKEQINEIINITKIYTNQNPNKLPEKNTTATITLTELKESNLIKRNQILDPKTNEELTGCVLIKYENNKYKYEYSEESCN